MSLPLSSTCVFFFLSLYAHLILISFPPFFSTLCRIVFSSLYFFLPLCLSSVLPFSCSPFFSLQFFIVYFIPFFCEQFLHCHFIPFLCHSLFLSFFVSVLSPLFYLPLPSSFLQTKQWMDNLTPIQISAINSYLNTSFAF